MFNFFKKKKVVLKIDDKKTPELYLKCNELPIHNFNEIMNGDFSYLKKNKSENVSQDILEKTWLNIIDEYLILSENRLAQNAIKRKAEVMYIQSKIRVFEILKYCIEKNIDVSKYFAEYKTSKEKITVHLGMLKNDFSRKLSSIPEDEKEENNNNFDKTIALILKNGYPINRFTTTVSEWMAILNQIKEYQKTQK